jgi:two-component system chemotaxis response regulator CheB
MNPKRIRLLVVDDSAVARKVLTDSLSKEADIEVIGTAPDPYVARDKILELNPDVITLDLEMPRLDGISFLRLLMKHRPMPVIVLSSLTQDGSAMALEALQAGAVDVMGKPNGSNSASAEDGRLADKVRMAAGARVRPPVELAVRPPVARTAEAARNGARRFVGREVILIGSSTGGTEALKEVLMPLRGDVPGICIVQHIPAKFSQALADRLNSLCQIEVREAVDGDRVVPGLALLAPGGKHMLLHWSGGQYQVRLTEGPPVHHQRPAVDVLFDSAVKAGAGSHALAIVLTGMGSDGAEGMLRLRNGGASTIAQNEETCVVFGMPREAIRRGAVQQVLPLGQISRAIERHADTMALPAIMTPSVAAAAV